MKKKVKPISSYTKDFEKDGKSYNLELNCYDEKIFSSPSQGDFHTELKITQETTLVTYYMLNYYSQDEADAIFNDAETKIETLINETCRHH